MKRNTTIVTGLLLLFSIAVMGRSKDAYFYYYKNKKVPLALNNEMGYGLVDAHAAVLLAQACQNDLVVNQDVLGGASDNREADQTITATNTIFNNGAAIYHAGDQVSLQPGFHAQNGAAFHAYVEGCTGVFQAKMQNQNTKTQGQITYNIPDDVQALDSGMEEGRNSQEFVVYPNPFTDIVNFKYSVTRPDSPVRLQIYNLTGAKVTTLIREERMAAGTHHAQFNGIGLSPGIYMYRLEIGDHVTTGKIILKK